MADDIVQELNDWAYIVDESQGKACVVMLSGVLFREAAAEIERLRAHIERLATTHPLAAEHTSPPYDPTMWMLDKEDNHD